MDYAKHMRTNLSFHQEFNIYSHLSFEEFQTVLEFVKNNNFRIYEPGLENSLGLLLTQDFDALSGDPNSNYEAYFFYTNDNMRFLQIYNQLFLLRSEVYNIYFTSKNTFGQPGRCHILYMKRQPYNYESDIRILVQGLKMQRKNTWETLVESIRFYNKNPQAA